MNKGEVICLDVAFVQITASGEALYGLDKCGQVWLFHPLQYLPFTGGKVAAYWERLPHAKR